METRSSEVFNNEFCLVIFCWQWRVTGSSSKENMAGLKPAPFAALPLSRQCSHARWLNLLLILMCHSLLAALAHVTAAFISACVNNMCCKQARCQCCFTLISMGGGGGVTPPAVLRVSGHNCFLFTPQNQKLNLWWINLFMKQCICILFYMIFKMPI